MSLSITLRAFCAAAAFTMSSGQSALAQTSPSPSPSPLPEIGHVQTSDRSNETITSAARTTYVVSKEQILRNGYRTIADAVASLPGVEISHYGAIGTNVQLGIRGSASGQVLILVDGIPAPGSLAGAVNLGVLPTSGVERIEVVEGGGSTLYGTGSIGGIINVITQAQAPAASGELRVGSFGDRTMRAQVGHLSFERIVATNAYAIADGTARPNSDYEATSVHAGFDRQLGSIDAALRAGITGDRLGAPGPATFSSTSSRESDLNEYASLLLSHRTPQSRATLQLGGSVSRIGFWCDATNDPNCFQPGIAVNQEGSATLTFRNEVSGASGKLLYGLDLTRGVVRSDSGGTATPSTSTNALAQTAFYAQNTWYFGTGSRFYAGMRAERDGALGGEFSPSAGFIARVSPAVSFKANFATAFRAPTASELYFPGYGNPALHAERGQAGDLTVVDDRMLGGISLGWFTNRTNNLIIPVLIDPVNFVFAPENIDHSLIQGLTLDVRTKPVHGVSAKLNVTDLYRATDLDQQIRLPHDPVFAVNIGLLYTGRERSTIQSAGISVASAGARGPIDASQPAFLQPVAYTKTDAFVRFNVARGFVLSVRAQNLGNERYAEVNGFPMPGRSFALEVSTH